MNKTQTIIGSIIILSVGFGAGYISKDMASHKRLDMPPPAHHFMDKKFSHHKGKENHFAKKLGLSAEQQKLAEENRQQGREKIKPLIDEMFKIRKQMDEIREANMADFEKILTPEQKEKFAKMKPRMEKRAFHKKGPKPHHFEK